MVSANGQEPVNGKVRSTAVRRDSGGLDASGNEWRYIYNYATPPLYQCSCGKPLDGLAADQLRAEFAELQKNMPTMLRYGVARSLKYLVATAKVRFCCTCGAVHIATFYQRLLVAHRRVPQDTDGFLLADVSDAQLQDRLSGLHARSDATALIEKLLMRWNLLYDQVVVASPIDEFLHTPERLEMWEWLLRVLDPGKLVFVVRSASSTEYRTMMEEAGVPSELLQALDWHNQVVTSGLGSGLRTGFLAGLSADVCEVYSGSANLVRGTPNESMYFSATSRSHFEHNYLAGLHLRQSLPQFAPRLRTACLLGDKL